ncbi:MAG TPA: DPP IV N-terminal domain-containing protein, partial [Blastocatellia bacterium]|nr:DPP IV N-terminal domain-containing protein [Blastocatellia bacterium]
MSNRPWKRSIALSLPMILIAAQITSAIAQQKVAGNGANRKFELTIDNIMRGLELVGYEPRAVHWSPDSQRVYFQWKQANEPREKDFDNYVVNRDGSGLKKLSEEEAKSAPPLGGEVSKDKKLTLFVEDGDVFIYDNVANQRRRITSTTDAESNAHFTRDQKHIYFTRANNLYVMSLETGSLVQLTEITTGGAAPATVVAGGGGFGQGRGQGGGQRAQNDSTQQKGTDSQEYLKKEERDLLDVVKRRAEKREQDEAKRKREHPRKPFQLSARQTATNLQLTPDEKSVIVTVNETAESAKNTIVPNFVTETSYTEDIGSRTKVGDTQNRLRLAIVAVDSGEVKWVDHGQKEPLAASTETRTEKVAAERRESEAHEQQGGARTGQGERRGNEPRDRDVQLFQPIWSEDGTKAVLMARAADNKDRWVLALDPATAKTRVIVNEHDDAWVDGPGAFTLGWMKDNQHIYFQSERTGYAHLYTVSYDGGEPKQLTSGKWEVTGVQMSDDKSRFFLTTSEVHPGERHLYTMTADGGERTRITSMPGGNQAFVSPDEKMLSVIYSHSNKPP